MGIQISHADVHHVYGGWDLKSEIVVIVVFYDVRDQCCVVCRMEYVYDCDMVL